MEIQELKRRLTGKAISGIKFPTDSDDYVGIIMVRKRFSGPLTLEDVEPNSDQYTSILKFSREEPESYQHAVATRHDVKERPIMVLVMELTRTVYEGPDYPDEEDYRSREWYYVRSVQDVEEVLDKLGYSTADLVPLK